MRKKEVSRKTSKLNAETEIFFMTTSNEKLIIFIELTLKTKKNWWNKQKGQLFVTGKCVTAYTNQQTSAIPKC